MRGFRDIHSHFVYGVDDGARTRDDMEAMLDAAYADGITVLVSTPHVTPGLRPFDMAVYDRHLNMARAYCADRGYGMKLERGAEILYTPALIQAISHLPTLGESRTILVEFVPDITRSEMERALDRLMRNGYHVVMAHVERYDCLYRGGMLKSIRQQFDVKCQMNCRTLSANKGLWRGHCIKEWLRNGLIDCVASDAHNTTNRSFGMTTAYHILKERVGCQAADAMLGVASE